MKKYLYLGPDSGVTLRLSDGKAADVMLWHGREVKLPPDNDYTRTLLGLKLLQPVAEVAPLPVEVDAPLETATAAQGSKTKGVK